MKVRKVILIFVAIIMVTITVPFSLVMGGEPPPGADEIIVGPTMWAVGVCSDAATPLVTLRVKKIEGCVVDTDPQSAQISCPTSAADVLYYRLARGSVFSKSDICEPIITKVKNFKVDGSDVSFDAQINFVVPSSEDDDVCE